MLQAAAVDEDQLQELQDKQLRIARVERANRPELTENLQIKDILRKTSVNKYVYCMRA